MRIFHLYAILTVAIWIAQAGRCKRFAACYCPSSDVMRCAGDLPINIDMLRKAAAIFYLRILDVRGRLFSIYFIRDVIESCPEIQEINAIGCDCSAVEPYLNIPGIKIWHTCDIGHVTVPPDITDNDGLTTVEYNTTDGFPFIPWWLITVPDEETTTWEPTDFTTEEFDFTTEEFDFTTEEVETTETTEHARSTTRRFSSSTRTYTHKSSIKSTPTRSGNVNSPTPKTGHAEDDGKFPLSYRDFSIIGGLTGSAFVSFAIAIYIKWRKGYFNTPRNEEEQERQRSSAWYCFRLCMRCILPHRNMNSEEYENLAMVEGVNAGEFQAGDDQGDGDSQGGNNDGNAMGARGSSFESIDIEDIGQASGGGILETERSHFWRRSPRKKDASSDKKSDKLRRQRFLSLLARIRDLTPQQIEEFRQERYGEKETRSMERQVNITVNPMEGIDYVVESVTPSENEPGTDIEVQSDESSTSSIEIFNIRKLQQASPGDSELHEQAILSGSPRDIKHATTLQERAASGSQSSDTPPISIFFPEESGSALSEDSSHGRIPGRMHGDTSVTDMSYESDMTLEVAKESSSGLSDDSGHSNYAKNFRPASAPASLTTSQESDEENYVPLQRKFAQSMC